MQFVKHECLFVSCCYSHYFTFFPFCHRHSGRAARRLSWLRHGWPIYSSIVLCHVVLPPLHLHEPTGHRALWDVQPAPQLKIKHRHPDRQKQQWACSQSLSLLHTRYQPPPTPPPPIRTPPTSSLPVLGCYAKTSGVLGYMSKANNDCAPVASLQWPQGMLGLI